MKKAIDLQLTGEEKQRLKGLKITRAALAVYAPAEIAALLKATPERARELRALAEFQNIPSLGIRFARELINQGYYSLDQLRDKDPVELYHAFERHCGAWADPCVEDSYRLLAHYIKYRDTSKRWWDFTAQRKAYRAAHGYPADRPVLAWHQLPAYQK